MKARSACALFVMLLLSSILVHSEEKPAPPKWEALITPVLKARCEAVKSDKDVPAAEYDRKVAQEVKKVLDDTTEVGDEATVILLDYWLGEGVGLPLGAEITQRGKRLLPLLKKYRKEPPPLPSPCKYATLDEDIRQAMFQQITEMVEAGEKL